MLNIIKRPIFTPKTTYLIEMLNQYAFEVDSKITKPEMRLALEEIFSIDITSVNTCNRKYKKRSKGGFLANTTKHTIVTVAKTQRIIFF